MNSHILDTGIIQNNLVSIHGISNFPHRLIAKSLSMPSDMEARILFSQNTCVVSAEEGLCHQNHVKFLLNKVRMRK